MMMAQDKRLTNKVTKVQCKHNNTGFCKFGNQCKFQHFYKICLQSVCRNPECKKRHPKMCRFGERCKFNFRNACAYKHAIENGQETHLSQIGVLQEENKILQTNISDLKNDFQHKEKELRETTNKLKDLNRQLIDLKKLLNEEKVISKTKINEKVEEITAKSNKIIDLEKDNEDLKKQNKKIGKSLDKLKSEFECDKCTFGAETMTVFLNRVKTHTKGNHRDSKSVLCNKTSSINLPASNQEDKKISSCDKCDLTYCNQFDLLIHKSANHPTYILNSQPEAMTGPLH